jgi:hypothetical protein
MSTITYCVGINRPYDMDFIDTHINFVKELNDDCYIYFIFFDNKPLPSFDNKKIKAIHVNNWGGGIGLLDQCLDNDIFLGDYILFFEADVFIKCKTYFEKFKTILNENPHLIYLGHISSEFECLMPVKCHNTEEVFVKHNPNLRSCLKCAPNCYWTDGGIYMFTKNNLLKAKKILKTLPGILDKDVDCPLEKNSLINFRDQGQRVLYHEVGFPSRLWNKGLQFGGLIGAETILRKSGII